MSNSNHYDRLFAPSLLESDESRLNVITPATTEPVTLALARRQCRVDVDPTLVPPSHPDDELIALYLTAAREWCELVLGMVVSPTTVEMKVDDFPSGDIVLESWPVLNLSSITYVDPETETILEVDPFSYRLDTRNFPARIRLNPTMVWPVALKETDGVVVRYDLGYSTPGDSPQALPLPARIKLSILLVMTHFYEHRSEQLEQLLETVPLGARSLLTGLSVRRGFA